MAFSSDTALTLLRRAYEQNRFGHAYLVTGFRGSGKRALAENLARMVTGSEQGFSHPDVHTAEPESKSRRLRIEQTRALERQLQMRAMGSGRKVAVIFDADRLTTEAANAFLKTLEEPPNNSLIVLTSEQPEMLPDTVLSRCISVPLSAPGEKDLVPAQRDLLDSLGAFFAGNDRGVAAVYGLVRKFTQSLQQLREQISELNDAEMKGEESRYKQTTDNSWLDDREDFYKALTESRYLQQRALLLDTLIAWWADILRQQQSAGQLDLPEFAATTASLAKTMSTAETLRRVAALEELRENFGRNVKEDLAIEVAFLNAFGD